MHTDAELADRYVVAQRRYMKLMSGNVMGMPPAERAGFASALAADARQVTDEEITRLLDQDWRAQLTAAWLAGLTRRTQHREKIGELLLASKLVHAGKGFCFALTRFGTGQDARILAKYLDVYLPRLDLRYDQPWVMAALIHLDAQLGTHEADRYLSDGWPQWAAQRNADLELHRHLTTDIHSFADDCMKLWPYWSSDSTTSPN
jgi:hypothetical protein